MQKKIQQKNCGTIGLLIDWAGNPFGIKIWSGITDYTRNNGANVICFVGGAINTPFRHERQSNALFRLINSENVDGLVVLTSLLDNFIKEDALQRFFEGFGEFPVMSVGRSIPGVPSLLIDNAWGMRGMLRHLIELDGRRRLAYITGPSGNSDAMSRYRVFKETLAEYQLPFDPGLIIPGKYDIVSGQLAVFKLLDGGRPPFDAIVAANDSMALGAITALQERGIEVPAQVAVTGFNDFKVELSISPALTTVHQPLYEIGWNAGKMLLDSIRGAPIPEINTFKTTLVIRESCGCITSGQNRNHPLARQKAESSW